MPLSILILASLSAPLVAMPLHKCVGAEGLTSYQDRPCAPGQDTAWVRDAPRSSAPATAALPAAATAAPPPAARRVPPAPSRPASAPAPSRCEAARRAADELRDRQWNRLSFRQRSELDDRVARACRRR